MRWHEKQGLPVHRLPGGGRAPVHAYADELDRWLASGAANKAQEDQPDGAVIPPPSPVPSGKTGAILAVGLVLSAAVVAAAWPWVSAIISPQTEQVSGRAEQALDADLQERFLAARNLWSGRSGTALAKATEEFEAITREAPDYAPGWAALAESWLLSREFGAVSDASAFTEAEKAAQQALAIDPGNAAGHRALGFLQYWWKADPRAAGQSFRHAIELAPGDAQSHFWYGNILSDNGEHASALEHLAQAQTLNPGNVALEVDYAWALWQAGSDAAAARLFARLEASDPDHVVLHACLADIALIARDWPRYISEYERYSQLRDDAGGAAAAQTLRRVLESSGEAGFKSELLRTTHAQYEASPAPTRAWLAMVASAVGERGELVSVLRDAAAAQERWGSSGYRRAIAEQWPGDSEIARLIAAIAAPKVEPADNQA